MKARIRDIGKLQYRVDQKFKDPNWARYGKGTMADARKDVYVDILQGFRSWEEADEYIKGQPADNVIYTAMGDEISFSMIRVVLDHIKQNKWFSPWAGRQRTPMTMFGGETSKALWQASWGLPNEDELERLKSKWRAGGTKSDQIRFAEAAMASPEYQRRVRSALKQQYGDTINVYRGGRWFGDYVSVTTDIDVSRQFAKYRGEKHHLFKIRTDDVIAVGDLAENELIVKVSALQPRGQQRSAMLVPRKHGERRTAFYVQFWSPKSDPEISQPYYHSGPEEGAYKDLDKALRAASQLLQDRPDAFHVDIYSQGEEWIADEDDPRFGYWEIIEGTVKGYDTRGKLIYDEKSFFQSAPSLGDDKLFTGPHRPLPPDAY